MKREEQSGAQRRVPNAGAKRLLHGGCMAALALGTVNAPAQQKLNYAEHILPLVEANCSKCHNPDKRKADLDLTSFQGVLKGSGSGPVVVSGNLDGSKLWKALTHAEEPFMPPNRPKLEDKELEVFKQWIMGGLLENAGAKALAAAKPTLDLALSADAAGKPEGPPSMPRELPLEPVVHSSRLTAITGLTCSPWAPVLAVAGQKQVLLYNTETLQLLGILPFAEGEPVGVKFSRGGQLLLAYGGRGAKSGRVLLWNVTTGERLATLGDDYDTVLAADLRPDQTQVACGGPNRLVKIWSTKTGELQHKLKKHTDWVTAVAFSANGRILASGDRNGGISLWDPDSGQELFTLAGHKAAVTALSWRGDSKLLASTGEDGTLKVWEPQEGKQIKSTMAHDSGALCVNYAHDGRLVTCGRNNVVSLWNLNGGKLRDLETACELPLCAAFSCDDQRIFASDFSGRLAVWSAADGKKAGELDANPSPLAEQVAEAKQRLNEAQASKDTDSADKAKAVVTRLEAAQLLTRAYQMRELLGQKKREHDKVAATVEANTKSIHEAKRELAAAAQAAANAQEQLKAGRAEVARKGPVANRLAMEIKLQQAELDRLLQEYRAAGGEGERSHEH